MGGNALKSVNTRRYDRDEYLVLERRVVSQLTTYFKAEARPIQAYSNKPSFGDMDVLLALGPDSPTDVLAGIKSLFNPTEWVKNGNVYSFDVESLQIDVILTPLSDLQTALTYFAFNDLGNLMGRVAHKLGFKYGHRGLSVIVKDGDYVIGEHVASQDSRAIFTFLGYDYDRYLRGFDELLDVFQFAASSPYFNKDIYLLDNRNNKSRVRDAKRKTYSAFLDWLEDPELVLPAYPWATLKEQGGRVLSPAVLAKADVLFPGTTDAVNKLHAQRDRVKASHDKWNGILAGERTGRTGKALGLLMAAIKEQLLVMASTMEPGSTHHDVILSLSPADLIALEQRVLAETGL